LRPVGRVGRPHGLDGSFYVESADSPLSEGSSIVIAGRSAVVERRAGTDQRPLIRASGIDPREVRGETISVDEPLLEGEYLAEQLVGLEVAGVGRVARVVNGPSCDVLDVDGTLIPFIADAVTSVDLDRGVIEVDRGFLGL
jgi:16S rRNA processing protein RimM